jgi:hypothetical protein
MKAMKLVVNVARMREKTKYMLGFLVGKHRGKRAQCFIYW